jgi:hypothetical protein
MMSGCLLHANAKIQCSHSAQVQSIIAQNRVRVSGQPVATVNDQYLVSGCPFTVATKPQPCARVQWSTPSMRVKVLGQKVLLDTTPGVCYSAENSPQGKANPVQYQTRVRGM